VPAINNVTRFLDARGIRYQAFDLPDAKLGAIEAARLLKARPAEVFKTIVVTREGTKPPLLVLVPGTSTVDLKRVATLLGEKKVHMPTEREAEKLTGLQAGGISPLALISRGFRTVIDLAAREHTEIHVSGGQRGLNIRLGVEDLAALTGARFASVSSPASVGATEAADGTTP
jgi:Cys-tRNA(Pro)/Cys-tRNA(Cys) deacylase